MSEIHCMRGGINLIGREAKKDNDLFFTCSLIEYIARKTKNPAVIIANSLGKDNIAKIYDLADVYHSDNIETVSDFFINDCSIENGDFDNVKACKYQLPSYWDIGKIYKRLIIGLSKEKGIDRIDALLFAYNSPMSDILNNYNCSFYYDAPQNILNAFLDGEIFRPKL